jgi:glycosyltransferase involved in cell wall biosynthesis
VVNDASPDAELSQWLSALAKAGKIILLEQKFNTGFIGAVNRGMSFDQRNDVVLLNADTQAHGDWLDRLRAAAYHALDIGTVTPLSNHGELVSVPRPMRAAPMPDAELLAYLDAQCSTFNPAPPINLPTGVGFCFYIRRACLNHVGLLDGRIERGYGEESDFCLRAAQAGWRSVCAPNVFIAHQGSVSFGDEKQSLVARNVPLIHQRYPEHEQAYDKFLEEDPLYEYREKLQRALLPIQAKTSPILILAAEEYGIDDGCAARFASDKTSKSLLYAKFSLRKGWSILLKVSDYIRLSYRWPADADKLHADLQAADFKKAQIHGIANWPFEVFELVKKLGIAYDVLLTDYSGFCLRRNLLQDREIVCQIPKEEQVCLDCVALYGSTLRGEQSPREHRAGMLSLFASASKVYIPTQFAIGLYQAYFPTIKFHVSPVPRLKPARIAPLSNADTLRIAVFEAGTPAQGFYKILQLARWLASSEANAELIVLGQSWDDAALLKTGKAWVMGTLEPREIRLFCRLHHCALAFHAAVWPELDSRVIRLARHCGLRLAVPRIGVYAELLDEANACYLPVEGDMALWTKLLLTARQEC